MTYQDILQLIHDGIDAAELEAVLSSPRTPLTDAQIESLRADFVRINASTEEAS